MPQQINEKPYKRPNPRLHKKTKKPPYSKSVYIYIKQKKRRAHSPFGEGLQIPSDLPQITKQPL